MSVEAITWALGQEVPHSSAKFVLVVLANCASGDGNVAYPSTAYLSDSTCQDRKTVLANLQRLQEMGFITDTGQRVGRTRQIIVYRLNMPENGTVKESRKRNSTENGTVPFFPGNSTVFPSKQSQKRDTEPSGTVKEPKRERDARAPAQDDPLPDVDPERWQLYLDQLAEDGRMSISRLKTARMQLIALAHAGHDPNVVLEAAVMRGKRDLKALAAQLAGELVNSTPGGTHADRTQGRGGSAVERVRAANERAEREEQAAGATGAGRIFDA
jgi:hypothetical protein